ncbi:permease [Litchfieldia salsa]|uniref:Permease n=1 Tax=Litchfieldia salsa TaxID=930152 RepID=A0A1H0WX70_9BACI|nr:permease [Litchfieldia salsa]SDP95301.1 hypothetical protein SAMN05216565_11831 [Litchfieldia salsa]
MRIKYNLVEIYGFIFLGSAFLLIYFQENLTIHNLVFSESFLTFNMIFLSIFIEAIPFVLIGVFIAGFIQVFVSEDHLKRLIPKNKFSAVLISCLIGALFPACECGIVPIVRRLIAKGVPLFAGVGFLLTGPLINPIVIFSTYMAFGENIKMAGLRMGLGLLIALVITGIVCILFKSNQMKPSKLSFVSSELNESKRPIGVRMKAMFVHAIDEFFDMGKFLVLGAILAAFVQTYVSTKSLLDVGGTDVLASTFVMMGLAYLLSLCSEADAFIAASFHHLFSDTSLLGFLIYGPMLDLKNTIMLLAVFRFVFVLTLMVIITGTVAGILYLVHPWI